MPLLGDSRITMFDKVAGAYFMELRRRRGWTQRELCDEVLRKTGRHMTQSLVVRTEAASQPLILTTLVALCRVFDVSFVDFAQVVGSHPSVSLEPVGKFERVDFEGGEGVE